MKSISLTIKEITGLEWFGSKLIFPFYLLIVFLDVFIRIQVFDGSRLIDERRCPVPRFRYAHQYLSTDGIFQNGPMGYVFLDISFNFNQHLKILLYLVIASLQQLHLVLNWTILIEFTVVVQVIAIYLSLSDAKENPFFYASHRSKSTQLLSLSNSLNTLNVANWQLPLMV